MSGSADMTGIGEALSLPKPGERRPDVENDILRFSESSE